MIKKYLTLLATIGERIHIGEGYASDIAQVIAIISLAFVCYLLFLGTKFILKKVL